MKLELHPEIDPLEHSLDALEFPKILQIIAGRCVSSFAADSILALKPLKDEEQIRIRQELVEEIRQLLATSGQPELAGLGEFEPAIDKASKEGILEEEQLWNIARISRMVHQLTNIASDRERYARLRSLLDGLEETPSVHSNIERFIASPGVFKEDASERLTQLRIAQKDIHDKLQVKLQSMLEDTKYSNYWQESLITIRNERFVLPLKSEHKQHIPSVIHDRSSSGATLFVEPIEIVPLNNQLRELQLEENAERQRIMRNLSGIVKAYSAQLIANIGILHRLDFFSAIAHFADKIFANQPHVSKGNPLAIIGARHPLLILENGRENIVPLDFELNPQIHGVIITGPNMGGKTVALKTIGLLSIMSVCGLPIPAESRTQIPLFSKVFADIGDEQSVEASISSYASHIIHYHNAAELADDNSLVLLDELGSSTDPQEGTPISWAFMEHLLDKRAIVIANTHLGGLLGLATTRDDIENAAMEFNQDAMEPTYRLSLGVPGRSWAMEISRMLGFLETILTRAKELSEGGSAMDKIISQLQRKLSEADDIRRRLREEQSDIVGKRQVLEGLLISNQRKEKELERLRRSYEELRETRIKAALEREVQRIKLEWAEIISKEPPEAMLRSKAEKYQAQLKKRLRQAEKNISKRQGQPKSLEPGERIFVYRLHKWGDVLDETDEQGFVRILVGNLPLRIHSSGVDTESEYERKRKRHKKPIGRGVSYRPREIPNKIDVRGFSREEAWDKVDHVIDDAVSSGAERVWIIHGKGTGALRRLIRDKLHLDNRVEKMLLPEEKDGGDGATVALIKS